MQLKPTKLPLAWVPDSFFFSVCVGGRGERRREKGLYFGSGKSNVEKPSAEIRCVVQCLI